MLRVKKEFFFLQQLTIHVGMRWKWRKEVDFIYQALLYLIMMNVKKIIFFNSFLRIARILLIHQNNYKFVRLMDDIEVNTFYPY